MRQARTSLLWEENVAKVEAALRDHLRETQEKLAGREDFAVCDVTLTYGELIERSNVGIAQGQKPYLDAVAAICRSKNEPSLDCLVVNRRTGKPGVGFRTDSGSWEEQVRSCVTKTS